MFYKATILYVDMFYETIILYVYLFYKNTILYARIFFQVALLYVYVNVLKGYNTLSTVNMIYKPTGPYFYMFYIIRPQNYKYTCATKLHNTFYRNADVHYLRVANVGSPDPMSM
jgi:hypothetical protein